MNGAVLYPDGLSLIQNGSTVNQTCLPGFELRGPIVRTCIAVSQRPVICEEFMGNWTGQAGMCGEQTVVTLEQTPTINCNHIYS